MIRIYRPSAAPLILRNRGTVETEAIVNQYNTDPARYNSGDGKLPTAKATLYGAKSVRKKLEKCQYNKCCYSEAKFVRDSVHVEHFRPKAAVRQNRQSPKIYPGYYWLVYNWSNLLLVKAGVNSTKNDLFPLKDASQRANGHLRDISLERPMFIDPGSEDPRDHIRFHNEEAYGVTDRGKYTVDMLLRSSDLDESRRDLHKKIVLLRDALTELENMADSNSKSVATRIKAKLESFKQPDAEYSSMAIDLLG